MSGCPKQSHIACNLDKRNNTQANKKAFPKTTNQWYGRQPPLQYEFGGPRIIRTPYVKERRIGYWSVD